MVESSTNSGPTTRDSSVASYLFFLNMDSTKGLLVVVEDNVVG